MLTLEDVRKLLFDGKEEEAVLKTNLVETLAMHTRDEMRPLTIILIDSYLDRLRSKETITNKDIQIIRLLHSQILDQLNEIKEKGLHDYLQKALGKLECYLEQYYNKHGYLPYYSHYEDSYQGRRVSYGYEYPLRTYYKRKFPEIQEKKTEEKLTGIDLTDNAKDDIMNFLCSEYHLKGHPDEEIQKVLEYTMEKLTEDLKEMRMKRLQKEAKLSKDDIEEQRKKLIDLIIKGLKTSQIGE